MIKNLLEIFLLLFTLIGMIIFPTAVVSSGEITLNLLLSTIVPALFPFFICSELILSLGLVEILACITEPFIRKVFRLPGSATVPILLGFSCGAPAAANLTANIYKEGLCTKSEAERIIAFTNNPSPLYIISVVGVGILGSPALGYFILLLLYSTNIIMALIMSLGVKSPISSCSVTNNISLRKLLKREGQPIGTLLLNAIKKAIITMTTVAAFVIFFAVFTTILDESGILGGIATLLHPLLNILGLDSSLAPVLVRGFFEMTIGNAGLIALDIPLSEKIFSAVLILAFSGISIHSQISAMISQTNLNIRLYLKFRVLQMLLCALICLGLFA